MSDPPAKKKVIKRRRRRKKGSTVKLYFTPDTQLAILEYLTETEEPVREQIYRTRIMPAFSKLCENLINVYRFISTDPYDELKQDCVTFLFETMKKFDHTRGTNAFSYFNVVAKNWLIIRSKQRASKLKSTVSIDDSTSLAKTEMQIIEEYHSLEAQDEVIHKNEILDGILKMLYQVKKKAKNKNEALCIDSVIIIFTNVDNLDLLNKSAILLYIKELSGLSQKQLTTTLHSIKKYYRELKKNEEFNIF